MIGGPEGVCWRVFYPRWWEVGRWIRWWLNPRPKGWVVFDVRGRKSRVRVVLSDYAPPNVPSPAAAFLRDGVVDPEESARIETAARPKMYR